jgi:hypothetical protein
MGGIRYIPWDAELEVGQEVLVVDCTHPSATTLTHNKGNCNPTAVPPSDLSTGLVLNAVLALQSGASIPALQRCTAITSNHFDVDALLSVYSWVDKEVALQHEAGGGAGLCFTCSSLQAQA